MIGRDEDYLEKLLGQKEIAGENMIYLMERVLDLPKGSLLLQTNSDETVLLKQEIAELKEMVTKLCLLVTNSIEQLSSMHAGYSNTLEKLSNDMEKGFSSIHTLSEQAAIALTNQNDFKTEFATGLKKIKDDLSEDLTGITDIRRVLQANKIQLEKIKDGVFEGNAHIKGMRNELKESVKSNSLPSKEMSKEELKSAASSDETDLPIPFTEWQKSHLEKKQSNTTPDTVVIKEAEFEQEKAESSIDKALLLLTSVFQKQKSPEES